MFLVSNLGDKISLNDCLLMAGNSLVFSVVGFFFLTGCERAPIKRFDPQANILKSESQTRKQLTVSTYPIPEGKSEEYFGIDMLGNGIIPVYVKIQNDSSSKRYIVDLEKCSLSGRSPSSSGGISAVADGDKGTEESVNVMAIIFFGPMMAFLRDEDVIEIAEIKERIEKNALRRKIIRSGEVSEGFMYFQAKVEDLQRKENFIHIEVLDLNNQHREGFDFLIKWERGR